ncbi:restriction endonuclease subunit S [uncultured Clostridium sp.]|uniref:restriction endonuclease subunit S n=1 Tax=uncultured Clostridium sp. TaxID=59620 RepID=UPI0025E610D6|nr:restriction endonuclease subunit S [uncultured Clostridium sp.]
MRVDELKNKILQLAIQGKLVPQDPNDEPASVLLERIKKEKEQLIKEKKIKKEKPLPEISEEEKAFEIPEGWEWCRLGEIGEIVGGGTPSSTNPEFYSENEIPWLTPADLRGYKKKYISKGNRYISLLGLQKSSARMLPAGSILFSSRAPIGYVAIASNELCTNQGFKSIVPYNINMNEFIYYFLKYDTKNIVEMSSGTTFKEISGKGMSNIVMPFPPLQEQKRIVAKVDELFSIIDKLGENKEALSKNIDITRDTVLQLAIQGKLVPQDSNDEPASVLLEKIKKEKEQLIKEKKIKKEKPLPEISEEEKSFEIPKGWEWCRLGEIGDWGAGATPSRSNLSYYNGDICWIKTGELNDDYINGSEEKITNIALKECSLRLNKIGDVLIAMYGATIGKLGILNIEATTNQACCACTPFEQVNNKYLYTVLLAIRQKFRSESFGGAQPNISKQKIINSIMPLPPFQEQKRIVAKVDEIMSYLDKLQDLIDGKSLGIEGVQAKEIALSKDEELVQK